MVSCRKSTSDPPDYHHHSKPWAEHFSTPAFLYLRSRLIQSRSLTNGILRRMATGIVTKFRTTAATKAWWLCSTDDRHAWQTSVANRAVRGYGCPYCSGRKVIPEDSFAAAFPEHAAEFHPTLNGHLKPDEFAPQSNKRVWWQCSTNPSHVWETTFVNRSVGSGCPDCLAYSHSLECKSPDVAKLWHPEKNGELTPAMIANRSEKAVWWLCDQDSTHEWRAMVVRRVDGQAPCPKCLKLEQAKTGGESTTTPPRSVVESAPEILAYWHPTKNEGLEPSSLTKSSSKKVWWQCIDEPDHVWEEAVERVADRQTKCRVCLDSRPQGAFAREKSLAAKRPDLLREWHPTLNGDLDPWCLGPGSSRRVHWQCSEDPEHVWDTQVFQRKAGSKCPFCSGAKVDSKTCLASVHPDVAKTWHPTKNGDLTPHEISRQSARRVWWLCPNDPTHEWEQSVQNRVNVGRCPECRKLERRRELDEAFARTVSENIASLETFEEAVDALSRLALLDASDKTLQQVLYRQVYAGIVTAMESYLSDTFINIVVNDSQLRDRFARKNSDFRQKKYNIDDVVDWQRNNKSIIRKYLLDVVFHNLSKVEAMFESVLKVQFLESDDMAELQRIVGTRHNIAHRNGRSKKGKPTILSVDEIDNMLRIIRRFVETVDAQVARKPWEDGGAWKAEFLNSTRKLSAILK